ncbi:MAG: response regulator [Longimicrobiales bacterium]|nr:response regulator [Longimicrobiales bacterium]
MAETARRIPLRALFLSGLALAVPLVSAWLGPLDDSAQLGFLTYVLALVPGFLLAYYRGWQGSALALAGGMAAITVSQVLLAARGSEEPPTEVIAPLVGGFVVVSIGIGWLVEAVRTREAATGLLLDPETGLRSRTHMNVVIETAISAATVGRGSVSAVFVNLPRLDRMRATHGEAAASSVVAAIAGVCSHRAPASAAVGRWGPGQFLIVLPQSRIGAANDLAEKIESEFTSVDLRWQPIAVEMRCAEVSGPEASRARLLAGLSSRQDTGARAKISAVVVSIEADHRTVARRALELNGLGVAEFDHFGDLLDEVERLTEVHVLVAEVGRVAAARSTLSLARRHLPDLSICILFVHELTEPSTTEDVNMHLLPGAISPERILSIVSEGVNPEGVPGAGPRSVSRVVFPDREEALEARIVVADDEPAARRALERSLGEIGFARVEAFAGGAEVLERIQAELPDLLILDLDMPEVDGFDVLEAIADRVTGDEFLPVLVVTGNDQWELRQRALRLGAKDFLIKPFDIAELGARAINLIQARIAHERLRESNVFLERRVQERTAALERAQNEILVRLAQAVEYRDDITGRHAQRVGELSEAIAKALGLPRAVRKLILQAAPLHDIGKIAIPDSVLMKPGELTREERDVMRAHTLIGAKILTDATSPAMERACSIALTHHERWDGQGYPCGIAGDEIPIEGRIVAVADVLDVLTHARPYKHAISFDEALERIRSGARAHFDPDVVEAAHSARHRLREILGVREEGTGGIGV